MIPSGQIFNTEPIDSMIERVNAATDCDDLKTLVADAVAMIRALEDSIADQLEKLAPILALLEAPTSLTAIIKWVKNFIDAFLGPYLKPYTDLSLQLAAMTAKLAELTAALQAAASRIGNCSIDL